MLRLVLALLLVAAMVALGTRMVTAVTAAVHGKMDAIKQIERIENF